MDFQSTKPFFVRIKCELGMTYTVAEAIMDNVEGTYAVYSTAGKYDLLAQFQIPADQSMGRFVSERLHKIVGIRDTYTLIVFSAFGHKHDDATRLSE